MLEQNPALGGSDITKKLMDYTVQMGGPIKKDKAFFFGSIQRYSVDRSDRAAHTSTESARGSTEVDAPADADRHRHPRRAGRPVQRDRPRRLLGNRSGD